MMQSLRWGLVFVLALASGISVLAQDTGGPGFDSTPVQIPAVVKAAPRPLTSMDLLTIRDLHGLSISPDGKYVAFVVGQAVYDTNSYRSGLYVIRTEPGSRPVCLGTAGLPQWDSTNRWMEEHPQWSPNGRHIMRRMRMTTGDRWQVWQWDRNGGPPVQITHAKGDVRSFDLAPDGKAILFTAELPQDPAAAERLSTSGILYDGSMIVYGNRGMIREVLDGQPPKTEVWIHEFANGAERAASPDEIQSLGSWESDLSEKVIDKHHPVLQGHHIMDAKVSPDRRLVAYRFLPEKPEEFKGSIYVLFSKPLRGGTPVALTTGVYFITNYWWSEDSAKLYYEQIEPDGKSEKLMSVPASGGKATQVFSSPGYFFSFSADQGGRYVACARETPMMPVEITFIDVAAGGKTRTLIDLNPEFENIQLSTPVRIEGINKLGDAWFAHLVKPLGYEPGKRYPTIVTTYRSSDGFLRGASGDVNPIQVYAAHGFAVLSFDFGRDPYTRLRPGNFDDFVAVIASPVGSIEMAIQKGVDMGIVDPAKVGITGYSRGTEITAYAITHTDLFRAASGAAGDASPFFYYMAPDWVKKRFTNWGLGGWPEGDAKSKWQQVAPHLNAEHIKVPVLNNDPDSEFVNDLALYTSLKELGKPVELFVYANEGHTMNQPRHRYEIYERNVDWFRFWLQSGESQDPDKKGQFERWHHLRRLWQKANAVDAVETNEGAND